MKGRVYETPEEAVLATAYRCGKQAKELAASMDMGKSEFSMKATGQGRFFNPRELVELQQKAKEYSILYTMADLLGFEKPQPKAKNLAQSLGPLFERLPEIRAAVIALEAAAKEHGK